MIVELVSQKTYCLKRDILNLAAKVTNVASFVSSYTFF